MRKFICAGNWKLNKNPEETKAFLTQFLLLIGEKRDEQFILFSPATNLFVFSELLKNRKVGWGPQNVFSKNEGAYTGETSAQVVQAMGATHCLVGHSERRKIFLETDELIAEKVQLIQSVDLKPMLCVGESLEDREAGNTNEIIKDQLRKGLSKLNPKKEFSVAYEPVWAIGTGKVASPEQAEEAHLCLRTELKQIYGDEVAAKTSILYGGSVKPDNALELSEKENIDGFLIGGASLDAKVFFDIFVVAKRH